MGTRTSMPAAQDAVCADTICTVSLLYDQSGRGNDIPVAPIINPAGGGICSECQNYEAIADTGPLTVGGHNVYSLYMDVQQGYRSPPNSTPDGIPKYKEPRGIYMLADGTHAGDGCCWDFGNVTPSPAYNERRFTDTLFFGSADYWGTREGSGPWFIMDFEAGVWAGGSYPDDPGWGDIFEPGPPNPYNPSLEVPFAIGFLKVGEYYALRMADLETADTLTTAYDGLFPATRVLDHQGGVILGLAGDNSHNSFGTFFEGAIVAGYPTDAEEDAVFKNVQSVGYGQ